MGGCSFVYRCPQGMIMSIRGQLVGYGRAGFGVPFFSPLSTGFCLTEAGEADIRWGRVNGNGGISKGIKDGIVNLCKVKSMLLDRAQVEVGNAADRRLGS